MRDWAGWRSAAVPYAAAHASKTLFWTASDIYFAFYLTEVCNLPVLTMGWLMAISYIVNAVADWVLGRHLVASIRTARGAAALQLAGALLCSVTLFLFALAALVAVEQRLVVSIIALLGFRLSYALYDLPQNSLLALIGRDDADRTRLAGIRIFVSGLARVALTATFVPLFVRRTVDAQIGAFLMLVACMAVLAIASAVLLAGRLRKPVPMVAPRADRPASPPTDLHLMMLVLSLGTTIFTQLEPYLAAFAMADRWQGAALLTALAVGNALSQPLWIMLQQRSSRRATTIIALATTAAGAILFGLFAMTGTWSVAAIGLVYGAGAGGLFFLLWSSIANHAAQTHHQRGATATLGAFTGSAKIGQAVAMLAIAFYLDASGGTRALASGQSLVWMMATSVLLTLMLLTLPALARAKALAAAQQK